MENAIYNIIPTDSVRALNSNSEAVPFRAECETSGTKRGAVLETVNTADGYVGGERDSAGNGVTAN